MNNLYENQLTNLLTKPGSFSGTPGYQFARDQGLQATERAGSRWRNSGNALTALMKFGTGLATQDYGSMIDRLTRLQGQEQQYDTATTRNANDFTLGMGQNALTGQRDFWNYDLSRQSNAAQEANNQNQFNLSNKRPSSNGSGNSYTAINSSWY